VYLGSASGLGISPAWILERHQTNAYFGYSVGTAGDVNGDGYSDIIVGAPSNFAPNTAAAYIYLGSASGSAPAGPTWVVQSSTTAPFFVESVGTAGGVTVG